MRWLVREGLTGGPGVAKNRLLHCSWIPVFELFLLPLVLSCHFTVLTVEVVLPLLELVGSF